MSYQFYMNGILLPVPPSSITIQTPNRNETVELIDGSEINILKDPGLKQIQFECLIPQVIYPFAVYKGGQFANAQKYLEEFEALKSSKKPFQFIITRFVRKQITGSGRTSLKLNGSFNTNLKVSLEDYSQLEDATSGFDFKVSISLKEYIDYGTQTFTINTNNETATADTTERAVDPAPSVATRTYTVQSGDSLWAICATQLGNGGLCWDVAAKNGIADPSTIYPGQVVDLTGF